LSLNERVWARVTTGDLGGAFELVWNPADPATEREALATRAELQAFCGNEGAALRLACDVEDPGVVASIRAAVAAARGDWTTVRSLSDEAMASQAGAYRAKSLRIRAELELGDPDEALGRLSELEAESSVFRWDADLIRARAAGDPGSALSTLAARARVAGAVRVEADVFAELGELRASQGDELAARKAFVRAVELWDDMLMTLPPPLRSGFWSDAGRQRARSASTSTSDAGTSTSESEQRGLPRLLEALRRLASERDTSTLLDRITDGAVSLFGAERGFVLLVDETGQLEPRTIRVAENVLGPQTAAFSRSIAETVLIDREPVVTVDAAQDRRVQDYMSVHQLMLKSVACLPIETRGRTWGVLYLEHRSASGRFSRKDLSLLRAFADQAALAIETAQLVQEVESQRKSLERANAALIEANARLEARLEGQSQALARTRSEIERLRGSSARAERWGLVGMSEPMQRVYEVIERLASNDVPVVVTGESGTGKEVVARAIHQASARAPGPFVSLSCGAIPEGLLESELFGHVAGAFTGAAGAHEGVFVQAQGGTLFMDEIGDMPPRMQLDLLRVLQERRVRPVGAATETEVDVRVITASQRPLPELIEAGLLREDLYYRLAVVEIGLPALRERRADIPLLCDHILGRLAKERGEPRRRLSAAAARKLATQQLRGNVRELEHLLLNASVFAKGEVIDVEELAIETHGPPPKAEATSYEDYKGAERERILSALNQSGWNRAQAARALGMARRTFYRRLKQHGIELPPGKC
jgi:transcriptional regulator with GAF, ATPase, and Fis domain